MKIKVNEKEYVIEFGTEAALHPEAIYEIARLVIEMFASKADIRRITSFMASVPRATLTLFYVGLLEHHGEDGDRSIRNEKDAKKVLKAYFKENPEMSFIDLMNELLKQIEDDEFILKTAVFKFLKNESEENTEDTEDTKEEVTA